MRLTRQVLLAFLLLFLSPWVLDAAPAETGKTPAPVTPPGDSKPTESKPKSAEPGPESKKGSGTEEKQPAGKAPVADPPRAEEPKSAGPTGRPRYAELPLGPDGKPRPLTLDEAVRLVLHHNSDLKLQRLELLKADTEEKKNDSQYTPVVGLKYNGLKRKEKPLGGSTIFSGTKIHSDTVAASVKKLFSSGTYFELEASRTRSDSNAGEDPSVQGTFLGQLAQPPLYSGALKLILRQELVKNAFGYGQRRLNKIARNNSRIQRETLVYNLSQLIVKTMVDYWSLSIAEEAVDTATLLLRNTRNVRGITARKRRLGLAEYFELNQWNALVAQAESQLANAELQRDTARRELLRTLNLPPDMELKGRTSLVETMPGDLEFAKDIDYAFKTRPDLKNLRLQKDNARAALELSKNQMLPSVTIGGSLAHRDYSFQKNSAFREVPSGRYPEYAVEFKVEYPLWDEGVRVDVRNAKISLRQLDEQDRLLRRRIADEIREGLDRIQTNFEVLKKAQDAEEQTQAYYYGLVRRYRQGRFTAVAVKNALDALAQSRQALMQARVNYNISLVRYDLARNSVFRKFQIDIDKVIDRTRRVDLRPKDD